MKNAADKHRRDVQFEVGELVYLKLHPNRCRSLAKQPNEKLAPRFYGPSEIQARIGPVAYKLQLPPTANIHLVFHVSQLRKALGGSQVATEFPSQITKELELLAEPEAVLEMCPGGTDSSDGMEVLIQWKGLPAFDTTWEPYGLVQQQFQAQEWRTRMSDP